jgi:hypothetical protein
MQVRHRLKATNIFSCCCNTLLPLASIRNPDQNTTMSSSVQPLPERNELLAKQLTSVSTQTCINLSDRYHQAHARHSTKTSRATPFSSTRKAHLCFLCTVPPHLSVSTPTDWCGARCDTTTNGDLSHLGGRSPA